MEGLYASGLPLGQKPALSLKGGGRELRYLRDEEQCRAAGNQNKQNLQNYLGTPPIFKPKTLQNVQQTVQQTCQ